MIEEIDASGKLDGVFRMLLELFALKWQKPALSDRLDRLDGQKSRPRIGRKNLHQTDQRVRRL
jgi:hypothetical protein